MSEIIHLTIAEKSDRLDRCLSKQLSYISRSRLQKLIAEGQVQLNDRVCREKKVSVNKGDRLQVIIPPAQPLELQPEAIPLSILYEDDSLIIVNKPAGLVVHPAPGHYTGTLVHALLFHCPNIEGVGGMARPGIVHRLDKDTTGAMVVAKTDFAHQHLQKQLKDKTAHREYWGVVYGAPNASEGTINLPLGRHPVDRKKMAVVPPEKGGREAITHWQVLERLGNYTLMQFRLETGRTHQIRVHSSFMGYPLVGDEVYSSGRSVGVNLPGQALHARQLSLKHPLTGEIITATAPLPEAFETLLRVLRQRG